MEEFGKSRKKRKQKKKRKRKPMGKGKTEYDAERINEYNKYRGGT